MGTGRTEEFRKDAVRIALTSGLSRRQLADELGGGMSTLNKWVTAHRDTDVVSTEDRELARAASLSNTNRTARSRTSGENLFVVLLMMLHSTQKLEPPANPARFNPPYLPGS